MATIAEQLASIKASKDAIKSAIKAKGVACDDVLSSYATRISSIPSAKTEETKTIDITANGTYDVTPSASGKVLSKVVVNAKVESGSLPLLRLRIDESTAVQETSGIFSVNSWVELYNEETDSWHKPSESELDDTLYELDTLGGGELYHLTSTLIKKENIVCQTPEILTQNAFEPITLAFIDEDADLTKAYVSGMLWHIPSLAAKGGFIALSKIYGQKF